MCADFDGSSTISPRRHGVTEKDNNKQGLPSSPVQIKTIEGNLSAAGKRFGIVVSRFNEFITERLFRSAFDGLLRCGAKRKDIQVVRVLGPVRNSIRERAQAEKPRKYDAIICHRLPVARRPGTLRCHRQRGRTRHRPVSRRRLGCPTLSECSPYETLDQAIDRASLKMGNKGFEAALAWQRW